MSSRNSCRCFGTQVLSGWGMVRLWWPLWCHWSWPSTSPISVCVVRDFSLPTLSKCTRGIGIGLWRLMTLWSRLYRFWTKPTVQISNSILLFPETDSRWVLYLNWSFQHIHNLIIFQYKTQLTILFQSKINQVWKKIRWKLGQVNSYTASKYFYLLELILILLVSTFLYLS